MAADNCVGTALVVPNVGGFVCSVDSEPAWIATVLRAWQLYYEAHGIACGRRLAGVGAVGCDAVGIDVSSAAEDFVGRGGVCSASVFGGGVAGVAGETASRVSVRPVSCDCGSIGGVGGEARDGERGARLPGGLPLRADTVVTGGNKLQAISGVDGTPVNCDGDGVRKKHGLTKEQRKAKRDRRAQRRRESDLPSGVEIGSGVKEDVPLWRRRAPVDGKVDLPSVEIPSATLGRNGKPVAHDGIGFWKSCSEETRLKLIESKAQMHISENLRKAKENENRIDYLNSTQAIVDQVTSLVGKAEEMAKSANDNRVIGWAKTVTSSSAESLAKTVPESVPSLSSYTSEADASELDKVKRALTEEKEIAVAEYKLRHDRMRTTLDERTQEVEQLKADIAAIKRKPVVEAPHGVRDKNLVFSVRSMPMSEVERAAVTHGVLTDVELVAARVRFGRQVTGDDFLAHKSGFNLSTAVAGKIAEAYERQIGKFKRNQVPYNFLN